MNAEVKYIILTMNGSVKMMVKQLGPIFVKEQYYAGHVVSAVEIVVLWN